MKILMSACLLGEKCTYKGTSNIIPDLSDRDMYVPCCPEVMGGLAIPRKPAEIVGDRVVTEDGTDVTEAYLEGARQSVEMAEREGVAFAVMKSKSPSCGKGQIYDGTFSHTLTEGDGITVRALREAGIEVLTEEEYRERSHHDDHK